MKKLIINANDFGFRFLFNKRILELISIGFVSSVSVMVEEITPDQNDQINQLKKFHQKNKVGVGLHLYFKNDDFPNGTQRQLDKFVEIFEFEPSHIDLHKSESLESDNEPIQNFCVQESIPYKNLSGLGKSLKIKELGTNKNSTINGTNKTLAEIIDWYENLGSGFHVINFHPGYFDPDFTAGKTNKEREIDAQKIIDFVTSIGIENLNLSNFTEMKKLAEF